MESRTKILGHAAHPILIVFPLGLLLTAIIFDIISLITDNGYWSGSAFGMIGAGVIGGLVAIVFGLIDWMAIPKDTRAKRIGMYHSFGNELAVVLFAISWFLRLSSPSNPSVIALILSFVGAAIFLVTGWLGGELVERLGVGVDKGANLDAPSSLSSHAASEMVPPAEPTV